MKVEDAILVGGVGAAVILALWAFLSKQEKKGEISGEIQGETTITVEPIK